MAWKAFNFHNITTGEQFLGKLSNSHYHCSLQCIKQADASFEPRLLCIPTDIKSKLTPYQHFCLTYHMKVPAELLNWSNDILFLLNWMTFWFRLLFNNDKWQFFRIFLFHISLFHVSTFFIPTFTTSPFVAGSPSRVLKQAELPLSCLQLIFPSKRPWTLGEGKKVQQTDGRMKTTKFNEVYLMCTRASHQWLPLLLLLCQSWMMLSDLFIFPHCLLSQAV